MPTLQNYLSKNTNLPKVIGKFSLAGSNTLSDGALQIYYTSENNVNGYFTITIYNSGIYVPDELDNPLLLNEYANCKNVFKIMEQRGIYKDVNIILEEPFNFSADSEPEFLSMILAYLNKLESGDYIEEISFFYLRSSYGYFHKIRYSVFRADAESNLDSLGEFLFNWNNFINNLREDNLGFK